MYLTSPDLSSLIIQREIMVTVRAYLLGIPFDWFCAALKLAFYCHAITGIAGNQSLFIAKMASRIAVYKITEYLRPTSSFDANSID